MTNNRQKTTKMLAAVIGGSAVVTMGALAMGVQQQAAAPTQYRAVGVMTVGATETASGVADTVVATSMAVPAIKGPAPLPTEEQAAE
jgi:hypothetical protein